MKSGLGLSKKYNKLTSYLNLVRFNFRKYFIGFDSANIFLQRVDKNSVQRILKYNGAKIGDNCDIETGLIFHNCKDYANLVIGGNCHIGKNCFFDLRNKVIIDHNVVISMQCTFITHIDMNKSELSKMYPSLSKKIVIHKNCYLGARSTILMGVELGESSIVAACSMVNKKVKKYTSVGGTPADLIKNIDFKYSKK